MWHMLTCQAFLCSHDRGHLAYICLGHSFEDYPYGIHIPKHQQHCQLSYTLQSGCELPHAALNIRLSQLHQKLRTRDHCGASLLTEVVSRVELSAPLT